MTLWTQALARGDEEAFHYLYDQYYIRLYRYLLVVASGNETLAKEALQEAMIRVAKKVKPMASEEAFWRWLTTVARNVYRDITRKQGRYTGMLSRFSDWMAFARPANDHLSSTTLEERFDEVLQGVLDDLEPRDRFLITGKYLERLSVKELALRCETTSKAIESKLTRLRLRVKKELLKRLENEKPS